MPASAHPRETIAAPDSSTSSDPDGIRRAAQRAAAGARVAAEGPSDGRPGLTMKQPLRALLIDDSPDDADSMLRALGQGEFDVTAERVDTRQAMVDALSRLPWDVIVVGYNMPEFSVAEALLVLRERQLDIPVIVVSGSVTDEMPIDSLPAGAHDFILKSKPACLVSAVRREVREAQVRRENQRITEALEMRERYFRSLTENAADMICTISRDGTIRYCSPAVESVLGYTPAELVNCDATELVHPDDLERARAMIRMSLESPRKRFDFQYRYRAQTGEWRIIDSTLVNLVDDPAMQGIVVNSRDVTTAVTAAEKIRESEERFRTLFETMSQGVVYQDAGGRVTAVNQAALSILGVTLEQLQGAVPMDPRWRLRAEDGSAYTRETYPTALALSVGQEVRDMLVMVFNPVSGDDRWLKLSVRPEFRAGESQPYRAYITFEDVTRLKAAEAKLLERTYELAERVKEANCLYAVSGILHASGARPETVLDEIVKLLPDALQRPDLAEARARLENHSCSGPSWSEATPPLTAPIVLDGETIGELSIAYREVWWDARSGPFVPEKQQLLSTIVDQIAEAVARRRAEEARTKSETYFRSLIENAQDSVVVIAPDGTYTFASPSHETITGYSADEVAGQSALQLIHPDDRAYVRAAIAEASKQSGRVARLHYRFLQKNGSWITLEATGKNLLNDPAVRGLFVIARDITKRQRDERAKGILREIDQLILAATPLDQMLNTVCQRIVDHFDIDLAWIGTKETGGAIEVRARAGVAKDYLDGFVARWDDCPEGCGPTGTAIRLEKPVISDLRNDPTFQPWLERARSFALAYVAALPLGGGGRVFGVLNLCASASRPFNPEMIEGLIGFADQVAISIMHAEHQQQIHLETAALEAAASAMFIADRRGIISWVNAAFTTLTGYTAAESVGQFPSILKSGAQGRAFYRDMWHTILRGDTWRGEIRNRRKDGTYYVGEQTITPVRDTNGDITHFVAAQQDITERKTQEESLVHLAMHDPLTDLPNRRAMETGITRAIQRAKRGEQSALLLLDVDNFKAINDSVGHPAGDRFLLQLGPALMRVLRPSDLLARFGGDEFAVLLDAVGRETAVNIAERLRDASSELRFQEGTYTFAPTISVGVALIDGTAQQPAGVTSLADAALHAAKEAGKNRVIVYQSMTERELRFTEASQWAVRIRDALQQERLRISYQPVINLRTRRTDFYEALIRLVDEDGSIIGPGAFIPAAERFGLSSMIDEWVVRRVVRDLQCNRDLRVALNVSATSLGDERLLSRIEAALSEAQLGGERLTIEITETAAVQDLSHARWWMESLTRYGCKFALDDFGMGFSSFSSLKSLPVDYVKIDGSFVQLVASDPSTRAVVEAMVQVAHALGKKVVAEWVESEETAAALGEMGAEWGQGFLWGQSEVQIEHEDDSGVLHAEATDLVGAAQ